MNATLHDMIDRTSGERETLASHVEPERTPYDARAQARSKHHHSSYCRRPQTFSVNFQFLDCTSFSRMVAQRASRARTRLIRASRLFAVCLFAWDRLESSFPR